MTTVHDPSAPPAQEQHAPFVPGSVVRALGALVDPEAVHEACRVVHLKPRVVGESPDGDDVYSTVVEAIEGRVFVRATYAGPEIDDGVLLDAQTAGRFLADEYVEIDGREIVKPFRLPLLTDEAGDGRDAYPDLDPLVPKPDQRLLFAIDPKELSRALKTIAACGVKSVEVLQPEYRGGPLGLRGSIGMLKVEACVMPRQPFTVKAQAKDDVAGQQLFDFRDVGDALERAASGLRDAMQGVVDRAGPGASVSVSVNDGPELVVARSRKKAKRRGVAMLRGGKRRR